jgi:LSD1 subclass zinc finger protein
MANEREGLSTAESLRKTRTYGQVRCHNPSCMGRLHPERGATQVKCSACGSEFRVAWVKDGFPRIRGPVWEVNQKLAEEALARKMKEEKKDGPK